MINISNSNQLTVEITIVEIRKNCKIRGLHNIDVPFKIVCDLKNIPKEKHTTVIKTLMTI